MSHSIAADQVTHESRGSHMRRWATIRISPAVLKSAMALLPFLMVAMIIALRAYDFEIYRLLFKENSLFESLTSLCYLAGAVGAGLVAAGFWRRGQGIMTACYAVLALGLFFVFGEEISWAQRLLGIETPEAFLELNTQGELTIHNLEPVQRWLHDGYIVVGAYGAFAWLLGLLPGAFGRLLSSPWFVPRWYLAPYFLPVFAFYLYLEQRLVMLFRYRSPDQEPSELILSMGFLLFVLINLFRLRQEQGSSRARMIDVRW